MDQQLKITLTICTAGLAVLWLTLAGLGSRKLETANAVALLRYGAALRITAIVLALFPLAVLIEGLWMQRWTSDVAAASFFLGASLVAGLLLIEAERVQILLSPEGMTRYSPWVGLAMVRWGEIESVGYSTFHQWFVVTGAGRTIRVSQHLHGASAFAEAVQTRVEPQRWASAALALRRLAALTDRQNEAAREHQQERRPDNRHGDAGQGGKA